MTVCVCAHVCVCVHRGLSVRTFSCEAWVPARSPAPPRGISFRQWPMPWQLWPLAFLDMSLHMEGKMVRPGKTPRRQKNNKDIRGIWVKNSTSFTH